LSATLKRTCPTVTTSRARHKPSCDHHDNAHGILILAGQECARGTHVVSLTLASASSVICGPERHMSTDACDCLRERESRGHLTTWRLEIPSPGFMAIARPVVR